MRSISKAIETYFLNTDIASDSKRSLPPNILDLALQFRSSSNIPPDLAKLHDELLRLQQLASDNKIRDALFLECLSLLAPKLTKAEQLAQWFNAYVSSAINCAGHRNDVVKASQRFFLSVLENGTSPLTRKQYENGEEVPKNAEILPDKVVSETPSQLYFQWIFQLYEGQAITRYFTLKEDGLKLAERKRFIAQNAKYILTEYGRISPYNFFMNLTGKAADPEHRLTAFSLASNLVGEHSDAELSEIASTPFVSLLYNCLLHDNSFTALNMCINILAMLLPHIARTVNLQKLLVIFGRVASWHSRKSSDLLSPLPDDITNSPPRHNSSQNSESRTKNAHQILQEIKKSNLNSPNELSHTTTNVTGEKINNNDAVTDTSAEVLNAVEPAHDKIDATGNHVSNRTNWKILDQAFGLPDLNIADVSPLFTTIYGLFPHSFVAFANTPSKFLTSIEYTDPLPDNWDDYQIIATIKSLLPSFALNPFMITFTREQELSDERWERMGSAKELAIHCLGLRMEDHTRRLRTASLAQSAENHNSIDPTLIKNNKVHDPTSIMSTMNPNKEKENTNSTVAETAVDLPLVALKDTSPILSDNYNSSTISFLSPEVKNVDDLLNEHHRLYSQRSNTADDYLPIVPDNVHLNDSVFSPSNRSSNHISITSSPRANALASIEGGLMSSPMLIAQSEPSSSVTQLTVMSPLNTLGNGLQRNDTEPEPLRLSPSIAPAVPEDTKITENQAADEEITTKQQHSGSVDSSILFYQRELMLLKNEFDFVLYLQRHCQYQYFKILEERAKDAIYNDSIFDLIEANISLRQKLFTLENHSNMRQKNVKTMFDQQKSYETSLLQKNKDMRASLQEISRKASKLETELTSSKTESYALFESIKIKETKISEMEFKITELAARSQQADTYKKALADADEKIIRLEQKTASFLTPEESHKIPNIMVSIKELTNAKDAAENAKARSESQYKRQIANLQARLRTYEEKQRNPSTKLTQSIEDCKKSADEQYTQLLDAHKTLVKKYAKVNEEYQKYITDMELSNYESKRRATTSQPKSLLGYDLTSEAGPSRQLTNFSLAPPGGSSANTTENSSRISVDNPSLVPAVPSTASIQIEHQTRIKGRGGVQNTYRKKEPQPNLPRSGIGHFRGFM